MRIKKTILFIITLIFVSSTIGAQYFYYGKNKVRRTKFDWQYIETDHFNVYYYTEDKALIKTIAAAAEHYFTLISDFLNTKPEEKIPVIFYNTHIDFEQTNLYPGFLPPGVQAFAEPVAHRVVLHGDRAPEELLRTLHHELGHIFEYAVLYKGIKRSALALRPPPSWIMEGFAEFVTGEWESFSLLTVRDSVLNGQIPSLKKNWQMQVAGGTARSPYDFGHLVFDFIKEKYGQRGVRNLLRSFRGTSLINPKRNRYELFSTSDREFNHEFQKYARERFKKYRLKENPDDYSFAIGPEFPYIYSFSHQISPSGEVLAVLTANRTRGKLEFVLISMKDGKIIKNITPGFTTKYDDINVQFNPADGISFSWDNKSENIAFFVRKELDNYLVIMDVLDATITKKIKLKDINDPTSPDFSTDDKTIYFTGIQNSKSYLYSIDIETGTVKKHTDGSLFIRSITISHDGKSFVYSAKSNGYFNLYQAPFDAPHKPARLTNGAFNDITPVFSSDNKKIYFSSDELESHNIYSLDLESKEVRRYTDVQTGNFFPIEIPEKENSLVISSFFKSTFRLYKKDISQPLGTRVPAVAATVEDETAEVEPKEEKKELKVIEKGKYKAFKKFFIDGLPAVGIGYSTTGDFLGYTYLNASDLMGDHNFRLYIANQYGFQSYQLSYVNMKNRLQYFANLFSWNLKQYYIDPANISFRSLRKRFGLSLGLYYPLSRSYRLSLSGTFYKQQDNADNVYYGGDLPYSQYFDGFALPLSLSFTGETTRFTYYGPLMGHTFNFSFRKFIDVGSSFQDAYTFEGDIRKYFRIDNRTLLALRLRGFTSGGTNPELFWMGGDNTIRAAPYLRLIGNKGFHFNAEFRFSLIDLAATPIGIIGPVRGVVFFDLGGIWFGEDEFRMFRKGEGFKLRDAISSYGFGIQTFLFGLPFHFEWVYKTDFTDRRYYGFNFWIGFDF